MLALKDRTRLWLGLGLVAAGLLVALAGYLGVHNESDTALQLPYVMSAGTGALALLGLGLVAMRSHDDRVMLERLEATERTLTTLRDSNEYLTRLLEGALLPDDQLTTVQRRQIA
ncbi:MAG TPA: hypothetical protein VKJ83_04520 [Actinomycetota bacterium]|nr:hypothetical protein [Actinomycetota bacterium]